MTDERMNTEGVWSKTESLFTRLGDMRSQDVLEA